MLKRLPFVVLLITALSIISFPVMAQMTDEAVYEYVKNGLAAGKSQDALTKELVSRGVTKEQVLRIKNSVNGVGVNSAVRQAGVQERVRRMSGTVMSKQYEGMTNVTEQLAAMPDSLFQKPLLAPDTLKVFGHNIFTNPYLTFEPNENLATPENYKLGAGDEVIVDIWGANQNTIRQTIAPDGFINIDGLGLVYLSGMTIKDAEKYMRKQLNKIYPLSGEGAQSEFKLTLGALRTIQVNVVGEVKVPGTYFLSSLSSVYHALYRAGGFTELGSLRNIELIRNGKKVTDVDVYDFIVRGRSSDDIILQDGDVVVVPTYEMVVQIDGKVKRPLGYEMKNGETVQSLLDFAGGFKGDAYTSNLNVIRRNGREYQVYTVDSDEYSTFQLMDADSLSVGEIINRYENRVIVKGAVYRPGTYQFSEKINTVTKLIDVAAGLTGDAFTGRALLHREKKDLTYELISIDLKAVLNGTEPDVELQANDILFVSSIHDLNDMGSITVKGEVARPGEYIFAENTSVEDIIIQAGGLLESASSAKVDISRRIKDPKSTTYSSYISEVFTIELKDGYAVDGNEGFILQPYDVVYVRRSPNYSTQTQVTVSGEVLFPGDYTLAQKNTRLSDIVKMAGGVSEWAYVKGARLTRKMTKEEKALVQTTIDMLENTKDTLDVTKLEVKDRYSVGINLEEALAKPGSDADVIILEGDQLIIPEFINTVKISGNVLYPNVVTYNSKMSVKDYVEMAGGYGFNSKKNKSYIVYVNGTVARARKNSHSQIEPGCEIIVPQKAQKEGLLEKFLSIATTSSSIATMLATVANIILR